jgi:hypothetical protein
LSLRIGKHAQSNTLFPQMLVGERHDTLKNHPEHTPA